jgi:hypothetical protein
MPLDVNGHERVLNWVPSPPDPRDYTLSAFLPHILAADSLPSAVDLGHPLPIEDQSFIGACTAFGSGGAFEFASRKLGLTTASVSKLAQYFWTRALGGFPTNQDTGAYVRDTMRAFAQYGAALSSVYPYDPSRYTQTPPQFVELDATKRKALKYISVPVDVNTIKATLAAGYPVVIGFRVPQAFMSTRSDGMVSADMSSIVGGHCVLLVGYDDATGRFKIRNSWSTAWGDNGYAYILYSWLMALGDDFWMLSEVSGETVDPPAPPPVPPTPIVHMEVSVQPADALIGTRAPNFSVVCLDERGGRDTSVRAVTATLVDRTRSYSNTQQVSTVDGVANFRGDLFQSAHALVDDFHYVFASPGLAVARSRAVVVSASGPAPPPPPTPPPPDVRETRLVHVFSDGTVTLEKVN